MQMHRLVCLVSFGAVAVVSWSSAAGAQTPPAAAEPPPPPPADAPPPPPAPPPAAAPGPASFVSLGGDWKFGFHGIVGASFYVQDTPEFVFNGQGPLLALGKPTDGSLTTGGDVRQSRFSLSLAGPKVFGGATPKALVEVDFFGGDGTGGYGEVSVLPRLRLAYAELNWGNDVIRFGQDHELILGLIPEGMGHMAYPVTYFNGLIGWREPGIGYYHTIPMDSGKLELGVQIIKSDWQNPSDFGLSDVNYLNVDFGQLSGLPAFEGRVKYQSESLMAFVAGHYNHVQGMNAGDLVNASGTAAMPNANSIAPVTPTRNWDVWTFTAGAKLTLGDLVAGVNAYYGHNLGPFLGEELQFFTTNDIAEWGGWAEVGYNFTKNINAFVIGGTAQPNKSDIVQAGGGRLNSGVMGGLVRYQDGGFAVGPEFYHVIENTLTVNAMANTNTTAQIDVNQFMLSGMYFF